VPKGKGRGRKLKAAPAAIDVLPSVAVVLGHSYPPMPPFRRPRTGLAAACTLASANGSLAYTAFLPPVGGALALPSFNPRPTDSAHASQPPSSRTFACVVPCQAHFPITDWTCAQSLLALHALLLSPCPVSNPTHIGSASAQADSRVHQHKGPCLATRACCAAFSSGQRPLTHARVATPDRSTPFSRQWCSLGLCHSRPGGFVLSDSFDIYP
jgi:hypothetical protein